MHFTSLPTAEFTFNSANQRINVSRLYQITVHFVLDCLHRSFKGRIPGQQDRNAVGMSPSHRPYDSEPIAIFTDVEVRKQNIELVGLYFRECFRHAGRNPHIKATCMYEERKRDSNAL